MTRQIMQSPEDPPVPQPATKKPSKREQSFVDYYEHRRFVLIAKRDALDAEVKDIDKKLLALLPE